MFDPGEVLYLYESPPGIWLVILKGISWGMFVIFIMLTLKRYPEKRLFYLPFMAFYTFWWEKKPMYLSLLIDFTEPKFGFVFFSFYNYFET